jgi:hypothetical protein
MILGMLIVLTVAAFACETLAGVEHAAKEAARPQQCFLTVHVSENFSHETPQAVWGLGDIPVSGEGVLFLSKVIASKRFFREKKVESVVADQELSIAANAPVGVFSRPKVTSLIVRLFSAHIAVRK